MTFDSIILITNCKFNIFFLWRSTHHRRQRPETTLASPPSAASAFPRGYVPGAIRQRGVRITAAQEQSVRAQSAAQRRHQRSHCAPGAGSSAWHSCNCTLCFLGCFLGTACAARCGMVRPAGVLAGPRREELPGEVPDVAWRGAGGQHDLAQPLRHAPRPSALLCHSNRRACVVSLMRKGARHSTQHQRVRLSPDSGTLLWCACHPAQVLCVTPCWALSCQAPEKFCSGQAESAPLQSRQELGLQRDTPWPPPAPP